MVHVNRGEAGWGVEWWGERAVLRDPRDRFHTEAGWSAATEAALKGMPP